jgi:hypothetical protein
MAAMREWLDRRPAWQFALLAFAGTLPVTLLAIFVAGLIDHWPIIDLSYAAAVATGLSVLGLPSVMWHRERRLRRPPRCSPTSGA